MPRDSVASENADRCGAWRSLGDVTAELLPSIAERAVAYHAARARDDHLSPADREAAEEQARVAEDWLAAFRERLP